MFSGLWLGGRDGQGNKDYVWVILNHVISLWAFIPDVCSYKTLNIDSEVEKEHWNIRDKTQEVSVWVGEMTQ